MYNLRYHLASLISVFFALAIGLLLGGLVADRAPENVHEALLEGIERDINQVREDNAQLRAENSTISDFADVLLEDFTRDKLEGRTILVLGDDDQDVHVILEGLEQAGATTIHAIPELDEGQDSWSLHSDVDLYYVELHGIVNNFEPRAEGGEYLSYYFVYLREIQAYYEVPLIFATRDQSDNEGTELISYAWEEDFSGTNQLGERYGMFTLIVLLASDTQGKFGSSDNVEALYPDLPSEFFEPPAAEEEGETAQEEPVP